MPPYASSPVCREHGPKLPESCPSLVEYGPKQVDNNPNSVQAPLKSPASINESRWPARGIPARHRATVGRPIRKEPISEGCATPPFLYVGRAARGLNGPAHGLGGTTHVFAGAAGEDSVPRATICHCNSASCCAKAPRHRFESAVYAAWTLVAQHGCHRDFSKCDLRHKLHCQAADVDIREGSSTDAERRIGGDDTPSQGRAHTCKARCPLPCSPRRAGHGLRHLGLPAARWNYAKRDMQMGGRLHPSRASHVPIAAWHQQPSFGPLFWGSTLPSLQVDLSKIRWIIFTLGF